MSEPDGRQGNEVSRRALLQRIALAVASAGVLDLKAGQHVHKAVSQEKQRTGEYTPQCFNGGEYQTLQRLSELLIPADDQSGSALDAGAPEFIDVLANQNEELAEIFISGIFWLDREMGRRQARRFAEAAEDEQIRLLDELAAAADGSTGALIDFHSAPEYAGFQDYTARPRGRLGPGARFFVWARRLIVDAFYTSPIGYEDVGYKGNHYRTEYEVPQEAIDYVMKRSPLGSA